MKIGILTFFNVINYGAVLQAYALKKVLEVKYGLEVELVNYQPDCLTKPYKRIELRAFYNLAIFMIKVRRFLLFKPFRLFQDKHLNVGKKIIDIKDISKLGYDYIVVGSDQVWNNKIVGKGEDGFFLQDVHSNVKRIAYAASCGGDYSFLESNSTIESLNKFEQISAREDDLREELRQIGIESTTVIDPTLLLSDYTEFISTKPVPYDYIVVYNVSYSKKFVNSLKRLKRETGMKVLNMGPRHISCADINLLRVSPSDWVNYLYHATYVITNSFHGSVFSILFEKNFKYVPNGHKSDNRVLGLLEKLNLNSCIMKDEVSFLDSETVKWDEVKFLLNTLRETSFSFIKSSIKIT